MACIDLFPSPTICTWLGTILLALAVAAFAYSRSFKIEKLEALGVEFKLDEHLQHSGTPKARWLAAALLLAGLIFIVAGQFTSAQPEWPKRFNDVCTAEMQVSRVDDILSVSVNDKEVIHATYGQALGWISIKPELRRGANKIEVIVENGRYGGCGAQMILKLNEIENPDFKWSKQKVENQIPNSVCFAETMTLNLQ